MDFFIVEIFDSFDVVFNIRNFYYNVWIKGCQFFIFFDYFFVIGGNDFGVDIFIYNIIYFDVMFMLVFNFFNIFFSY